MSRTTARRGLQARAATSTVSPSSGSTRWTTSSRWSSTPSTRRTSPPTSVSCWTSTGSWILTEEEEVDPGPEARTNRVIKLVCMVKRRPGMAIDDFHHHWRTVHSPLNCDTPSDRATSSATSATTELRPTTPVPAARTSTGPPSSGTRRCVLLRHDRRAAYGELIEPDEDRFLDPRQPRVAPDREGRDDHRLMEVEEYARIAAAEDDHWWYRNTRALMAELLQPWLGTDQRILDAGCGPGNGAWLAEPRPGDRRRPRRQKRWSSAPAGPRPGAGARAERSRSPTRRSTSRWGSRCSTPCATTAAVRELRVYAPGGAVLLFEPAPSVAARPRHDRALLRRYRRDELPGSPSGPGSRYDGRHTPTRSRSTGRVVSACRARPVPSAKRHGVGRRAPLDTVFRAAGQGRAAAGSLATMSPFGTSWLVVAAHRPSGAYALTDDDEPLTSPTAWRGPERSSDARQLEELRPAVDTG